MKKITVKDILAKKDSGGKIAMIKKHYSLLLENKSEIQASLEIRTFILYYLKGLPGSKEIKNKICSTKDSKEIFSILSNYLDNM